MPHFPKPFFRKPRRRWYLQVNGKQVNLGPDRDEAFRLYHEIMADPEKFAAAPVVFGDADQVPLDSICDRFLEWVEKHRAQPTYQGYLYRLQRLIDRYPGITVAELRPFHVQEWADSYEFTVTSKRNYIRAIKACLRWALKQGYIDKNPIQHMEVPAGNRKDVYVSPELFEQILSHVSDDSLRDLFIVTYDVGCRPQESLRLERRHVDVENQRWVFPRTESKGKRAPRIVYLSETAMDITQRLMLKSPTGNLFRNASGKPWTPDTVNSAVDRIRLKMAREEMDRRGEAIPESDIEALMAQLQPTRRIRGEEVLRLKSHLRCDARRRLLAARAKELVPRYSLYALRHSWATNALKRGLDSLTVAILMGHQDPSTLAKVYQHLSHNPEHLLKQARRVAI